MVYSLLENNDRILMLSECRKEKESGKKVSKKKVSKKKDQEKKYQFHLMRIYKAILMT